MYTAEQFKSALLKLQAQRKLTKTALRMLRAQHAEPEHSCTARRLGSLMGWSWQKSNLEYGSLGKKVGILLEGRPYHEFDLLPEGWSYLSSGQRGDEFLWSMRPELAQALEELGLIERAVTEELEPEFGELPDAVYIEGATHSVTVNAYERNRAARQACIDYHGTICAVCDSDLVEMYGPIAEGFIHVHHLKPLSEVREGYTVDPRTDLVPVCPNCHAMLHRRTPPLTTEELRDIIQEAHR